jgi:hypothetical protein
MTEPIILSIILVVSLVGITIFRTKDIPESISAMVWGLKGDWKWLWSIWLMAVSILTLVLMIEILDRKDVGILGFIPMVCLCSVAVWPLFDSEHVKLHNGLAVLGGILSQLCVALINPYWLLLWLLMPVALFNKSKGVMIAECICYVAIVGSVI